VSLNRGKYVSLLAFEVTPHVAFEPITEPLEFSNEFAGIAARPRKLTAELD
jgi:hypothetical protein